MPLLEFCEASFPIAIRISTCVRRPSVAWDARAKWGAKSVKVNDSARERYRDLNEYHPGLHLDSSMLREVREQNVRSVSGPTVCVCAPMPSAAARRFQISAAWAQRSSGKTDAGGSHAER